MCLEDDENHKVKSFSNINKIFFFFQTIDGIGSSTFTCCAPTIHKNKITNTTYSISTQFFFLWNGRSFIIYKTYDAKKKRRKKTENKRIMWSINLNVIKKKKLNLKNGKHIHRREKKSRAWWNYIFENVSNIGRNFCEIRTFFFIHLKESSSDTWHQNHQKKNKKTL